MAAFDEIILRSCDGREFAISKRAAALSGTISAAIEKLSTKREPDFILMSSDGCHEFAIYTAATLNNGSISTAIEKLSTDRASDQELRVFETTQILFPSVNGKTLDILVTYLNGRATAGNDEEAINKFNDIFIAYLKGRAAEEEEAIKKTRFHGDDDQLIDARLNKCTVMRWAKRALDSFVRLFCINSLITK